MAGTTKTAWFSKGGIDIAVKSGTKSFLGRAPMVCFLLAIIGAPLIYVLIVSFASRGATGGIVFSFTTENYTRILKPLYLRVFGRSIVISVLTCALCLVIGYPYAYFAARLPARTRFIALCVIVLPFWTSSLLRTYGILTIIRTQGVINTVLLNLDIINEPLKMIYTYGAVLAGNVYMLVPFMILPVYQSVEKIDPHLAEASRDLGASRFGAFRTITLPLTLPGMFGGLTLVFIPAVGLYFMADILGGSKSMLLGNLITDQMGASRNMPFAAAISITLTVVMFAFLGAFARIERKGGSII